MVVATQEDGEAFMDKSSLTPLCRHFGNEAYNYFARCVRSRYAEAKASNNPGSTKITNAIVNSLVPKDAPCSFNLKIVAKSSAHYRRIARLSFGKHFSAASTQRLALG